jgi:hypothetical protein
LDLTRPSRRPVATKVTKGKEWNPDLKTSELDQITFLLYPNEVNCMSKGLERPGMDSGIPFWVPIWMLRVRQKGLSRRRLSSEIHAFPTSEPPSYAKLLSYYIQMK